ncbi:MAG: tripartite tricarboxylate transporter substrate binding protein [Burkholderiales bacterium]
MFAWPRCAILIPFLTGVTAYAAPAAEYPQRPLRMIVGLPAGGSTDIMGRLVAAKLSERFGQQVVFDNRPGASGIIGADLVAKSQPDGYTLLMAGGSFGIISSLYTKVPFDTARDFVPIALFATSPYVFVVHPSVPVATMPEFIAYAKARPGQLNFAGSTPGSVQRLSGELLKRLTGIDMLYVPYKGTGVLMPDLLGGRLQAAIDNVLVVVPYMKSGALRGLAVTSAKRSVVAPELPTIAESGVPGFQSGGWFGVLGPAGMPPHIVRKLNAEIAGAMQQPDVRDRLLAQGAEPLWGPPDDLKKLLAREREVWGKVIREAGIKPD